MAPLEGLRDLRTVRAYREAHPHQEHRLSERDQETQREIGYEYGKYVSPIHEGDIDLRVISNCFEMQDTIAISV